MEPNTARAEAERWLGISAKLLNGRDLVGSKSFALRARDADPSNPVADQILAVVDTLTAAEKRVINSGNHDWYSILQLPHLVRQPELINSHYARLVALLNPDHNPLPFADLALRLVVDAWSVLSDPSKKWLYDSDLSLFLHRADDFVDQTTTTTTTTTTTSDSASTFQFFQQQDHPPQPPQSQSSHQHQWLYQQQQQQQQHPHQQLQERQLLQQQQQQQQQHNRQPPRSPQLQERQLLQQQHHNAQSQAMRSPPQAQLQERQLLQQHHNSQTQPLRSPPHAPQHQQQQQPPRSREQQITHKQQEAFNSSTFQLFHQPPPQPQAQAHPQHQQQQWLYQQQQPQLEERQLFQQPPQPPPQPQPTRSVEQQFPPQPQKQPINNSSTFQFFQQPAQPQPQPQHHNLPPLQAPPLPQPQQQLPTRPVAQQILPQPKKQQQQPAMPIEQQIPPQPQKQKQPTTPPIEQQLPAQPQKQQWPTTPTEQQTPSQPQKQQWLTTPPREQQTLPKPQKQQRPTTPPIEQQLPAQPQKQQRLTTLIEQPLPAQPPKQQRQTKPPIGQQLPAQPLKQHHQQQEAVATQRIPPPQQQREEVNGGRRDVVQGRDTHNVGNDYNDEEEEDGNGGDDEEEIESFWTTCPYCYYTYEYPKRYQDCTLRCQHCRRAFQGLQIPNPETMARGGKETTFCSWGRVPLGFSMATWKKNNPFAGSDMGLGSGFMPFTSMFATPQPQPDDGRGTHKDVDNNDVDNNDGEIESFWTTCPYCYYTYEYPKRFQDYTLRCQNCRKAFHALQIPNPPPITRGGKESTFCCWGFYPLGFSKTALKKNNSYAGSDIGFGSGSMPFTSVFATPQVKRNVARGPVVYLDDDDEDFDAPYSSGDSDTSDDWYSTTMTLSKKRKSVKGGRGRVGRKGNADGVAGGLDKKNPQGMAAMKQGSASRGVAGAKNDVTNKAGGSGSSTKGKGAAGRKKLDLNVEFSNEVEEHAPTVSAGDGEEEEVGFFEGLDEFLSTLPLLHPVGEDKAKPS